MSHAPETTSAALPLDDPPAEYAGSWGLRTGTGTEVIEPPDMQRSSQTALPMISPPASRMRVTTVASHSGVYPSMSADPHMLGTPATPMGSFSANVFPASLPPSAPFTEQRQYQALSAFSAG